MRAWTAALIVFVEHMAGTTSDTQITTGGLIKDNHGFQENTWCKQHNEFQVFFKT